MNSINVEAVNEALDMLIESNPELIYRCTIIKADLQLFKVCEQEETEDKVLEIAIGMKKLQKEIENTNGNIKDYRTATIIKAAIYNILESNADYEIISLRRKSGDNF